MKTFSFENWKKGEHNIKKAEGNKGSGKRNRLSVIPDHKLSTFFFAAIRIAWIHRPAVANPTSQVSSALVISVTVSLINLTRIGVWTTRPKVFTGWKWILVIKLITLQTFTSQMPRTPKFAAQVLKVLKNPVSGRENQSELWEEPYSLETFLIQVT